MAHAAEITMWGSGPENPEDRNIRPRLRLKNDPIDIKYREECKRWIAHEKSKIYLKKIFSEHESLRKFIFGDDENSLGMTEVDDGWSGDHGEFVRMRARMMKETEEVANSENVSFMNIFQCQIEYALGEGWFKSLNKGCLKTPQQQ